MGWSKNNEVHRTLWAFARIKHTRQHGTYPKFAEGDKWTTDYVIKHVPGESQEVRLSKANQFAHDFDGVARAFAGSKYEVGHDYNSATKAVSEVLMGIPHKH